MSKPVIAVDVDDVLTASNEGVREYINATYGTKHTAEDYLVPGEYREYWDRVWGVESDRAFEWYQSYIHSLTTYNLKPIQGAIEAVLKLKEHFDLVIVSSRDIEQIEQTKQWLEKHLRDVFSAVEFLKLHPKGKEATKAMILADLHAQYLIDDNLDHCVPAQKAGVQTLLFGEYGWSRARDIPIGIVRVKDWAAVLEYFDGKG